MGKLVRTEKNSVEIECFGIYIITHTKAKGKKKTQYPTNKWVSIYQSGDSGLTRNVSFFFLLLPDLPSLRWGKLGCARLIGKKRRVNQAYIPPGSMEEIIAPRALPILTYRA